MTTNLTPKQEVDIITAYTVDLIPAIALAKQYGRTRQGIWKVLKRNGIEPSAHSRIASSCTACGAEIVRYRSRVRKHKHLFCNGECYYAFIEGSQQGAYTQNRHGQRVARAVVSQYFPITENQIVHHEDRNCLNNHPTNLKVFANHGDHIRYHRWSRDGVVVSPVWDGSIA